MYMYYYYINGYVRNFVQSGCKLSKARWREIEWDRAWELEFIGQFNQKRIKV